MKLAVIQNKIYEIRGHKVMLDFDLAEVYDVETRVLNQAIKRNSDSFPGDFMFRLTMEEWVKLRSQIVMMESQPVEDKDINSSQFVMSSADRRRGTKYLPYAFTEHGVTMLASVLKSPTARKMNIAIVRAFIAIRKMIVQYGEVVKIMNEIRDRVDGHDAQLNQIYDALENMLDKKAEEEDRLRLWQERERIGFKNNKESTKNNN